MSFTVKYKEITTPIFNQTMRKVYNEHNFEDGKKAYKFKKLVDKLGVEQKRFYEMLADMQRPFSVKDDEGKEILDPERTEEYQAKLEEFINTEIEIEWHMLEVDDLEGIKLTPAEVGFIEPILDDPEKISLQESQPTETL